MKIKSILAKILVLYGMVRFSLLLDDKSGALENPHLVLIWLQLGSLFSFKRFLWLVNVKDDDEDESEDNEAEG